MSTSPVVEIPLATISDETTPGVIEAWVDAAVEGGEAAEYAAVTTEAVVGAVAEGAVDGGAAAAATALAAAGATTEAAAGWTGIGTVIGLALGVASLVAVAFQELLKNEVCTVMILNNTPYTIAFDMNPGDEQIYTDHGKVSAQPTGSIPPMSANEATVGTFVFESDDYALYGTMGAIDLRVYDQANNMTLITWLNLAWCNPYSGKNWTAVAGTSTPLADWYNQVSSNSPGPSSAVTIPQSATYPPLSWSASVNSSSGSNVQVTAALSVLPREKPPHGGGWA